MIRLRHFLTTFALFLAALIPPQAQAQNAPHVTVIKPAPAEFVDRIPVSGTLVAREEVFVNTRINGQVIEKLLVDVGDRVEKGQLLAVLDKRQIEVQLAQAEADLPRARAAVQQARDQITLAKARLRQAQTNYDRNLRLRQSGTISQAVFDQSSSALDQARASVAAAEAGLGIAQAQLQSAETRVRSARLNLSFTEIRAPVAGIISTRSARLGAVAVAGAQPMFHIIRDGEVEVQADVIESDIGRIKPRDPVSLHISGLGKRSGHVRRISPRIDARTRLGTVRISLDSADSLRIGLFSNGWITVGHHKALGVPTSAVLADAKGDFVMVVKDGKAHKRRVVSGLFWKGMREIKSGLSADDQVMLRAGAFFRDGDQVTPTLVDAGAMK
ncbi:MAG: efflux RND transporter periplasmic adaptor subunit [Paracoccaceae bacterium]|nr:efflux RND transporter periplasmic adaptor subunit [Paracoccaceae bacterium]